MLDYRRGIATSIGSGVICIQHSDNTVRLKTISSLIVSKRADYLSTVLQVTGEHQFSASIQLRDSLQGQSPAEARFHTMPAEYVSML